ncbi:MAG TPA: hypothetical protein H9889_05810 [Candidatus Ignatzschineria merdigallinarum]|uniref:Uncharacterized protein n=1 Tax=Candidatus Ignatzschineria merdigallinarum TaxID=2838621 RepID=A0A9D1Q699_9GAMM|nr:hypothetical protein [Candidatus Ignatzschineria merdigallinarum]
MQKCFLGLMFGISVVFNMSFAENICMDLDRQEVITPPTSYPQEGVNMRCGWVDDHFSVSYLSSRKEGIVEDYDDHFANITALENSKALDDFLLDQNDPYYIRNQPFVVAANKNAASFVTALEIQHLHKGEVYLSLLSPLTSFVQLSCIDRSIQYGTGDNAQYRDTEFRSHLQDILLSAPCQEAIALFDIPLSQEDIKRLKPAEGSLN